MLHLEDWCDDIIMTFALQAIVPAVGEQAVAQLFETKHKHMSKHQQQNYNADMDEEYNEEGFDEGNEGGDVTTGGDGEGADVMEVDGVTSAAPGGESKEQVQGQEQEELKQEDCTSFCTVFGQYDHGVSFEGAFPTVSIADRESYAKRAVQLLSQLCMVDVRLLGAFVEIYSAWISSTGDASSSTLIGDAASAAVKVEEEASEGKEADSGGGGAQSTASATSVTVAGAAEGGGELAAPATTGKEEYR